MAYTAKYVGGKGAPKVSVSILQDGVVVRSPDGTSSNNLINAGNITKDETAKIASFVYNGETLVIEGYPFDPVADPPPAQPAEPTPAPPKINQPLSDGRLLWNHPFGPGGDGGSIAALYSLNTDAEIEVVEGMLEDDKGNIQSLAQKDDTKDRKDVYGVPSIMNPHAYLVLSPTTDNSQSNKLLVDTVDMANRSGKLWYESALSIEKYRANEPSTTAIIDWSREPKNEKRIYKFSDFAWCKYWKKIPNNYMITLRRFPYPVNDALSFPDEDTMLPQFKIPVSTMITYMGEDAGNPLNSFLSYEAGMNWGEVKSDVWTQDAPDTPGSESTPFGLSGMAKLLGIVSNGVNNNTQKPLDPYDGGPYANKIIGPIDVIQRVAKRERGLIFKQDFKIVFEYSARSIGGINTKAVMLDIMGNMMLMSTNSALFWGGMNRMRPGASPQYPFLGGKEGLSAYYNGDAAGWFGAITDQFAGAFANVGDIFGKLLSGDFTSVLSGVANMAVKQKSAGARPQITGIRSLLTGDNVGEWHMTVGNPFNPMIVVGNLICKGIKVEFNNELGPDDFPTEIKATITLEHGMDRDRDRIQSMFNFGAGRFYGLPKGFEQTFSSASQSSVDSNTGNGNDANAAKYRKSSSATPKPTGTGGKRTGMVNNPLLGDPQDFDRIVASSRDSIGKVATTFSGIMSMGEGGRMKSTPPPAKK